MGGEFRFAHVFRAEAAHFKAVPAAEEHAGGAGRRQPTPEAPVERAFAFFIGFHPEHVVVNVLAVHPLRQQVDDGSAPCAVDAVDDDEQGDLAVDALPLRVEEFHAQFRGLRPEVIVAAASAENNVFKHASLAFYRK